MTTHASLPNLSKLTKWMWIGLMALGTASIAVGCGDSTGDGDDDDDDDDGSGNSGNTGTGNSGNTGTGNSGNTGTGNTGNTSMTCDNQWSCINASCQCDAGPAMNTPCCDPEECGADPTNCDAVCEYCE